MGFAWNPEEDRSSSGGLSSERRITDQLSFELADSPPQSRRGRAVTSARHGRRLPMLTALFSRPDPADRVRGAHAAARRGSRRSA